MEKKVPFDNQENTTNCALSFHFDCSDDDIHGGGFWRESPGVMS